MMCYNEPMKSILLFIYMVAGVSSFAQVPEQDYKSLISSSFGNSFEQKIKRTEQILEAAALLAKSKGIAVQTVQLKTKQGQTYPALQIASVGLSKQNQEAGRVAQVMGSIPLILSPYDLSFGANAFFDPSGSKIGVPYAFILDQGEKNPSYVHELYHAMTFQKVVSGQDSFWAGIMFVNQGHYISSMNRDYYFRRSALDELVATSLSVKLDMQRLAELQKTLSLKEFNRSQGEAQRVLNEIYFGAVVGRALAKQVGDVTTRALQILPTKKISTMTMGNNTQAITETTYVLDSYTWEIVAGRGEAVPMKNDMTFTLYSAKPQSAEELNQKLRDMTRLSQQAEELHKKILSRIYVLIEYPDIAKTDVQTLLTSDHAFDLLDFKK